MKSILRFLKDPLGGLEELFLNYGVRTVFERLPVVSNVLSYLNGHKEKVGKTLTFLGAIIILSKQFFPEIPVVIDEAQVAFFVGVVLDLIGRAHAYDKERRGIGRSVRIAFGRKES